LTVRPSSASIAAWGARCVFRLCLQIDLEELTQIERVLDVNNLQTVSSEVVEAARDNLVIGQS
jgi:hypothetical protein